MSEWLVMEREANDSATGHIISNSSEIENVTILIGISNNGSPS